MSYAAKAQNHLYTALHQAYINQKQFDAIYDQADKTATIISGFTGYLRTDKIKKAR